MKERMYREACIARIAHYTRMAQGSQCPLQQMYFNNLIYLENVYLTQGEKEVSPSAPPSASPMETKKMSEEKRLTLQELTQYDGSQGKPAYVAVDGIVYDVSVSKSWGGGTHFGLYAGKDLTGQFGGCHKGQQGILANLPRVGILVQ